MTTVTTVIRGRVVEVKNKKETKRVNDYLYTWYGDKDVYKDAAKIANKLYLSR